MAAVVLLQQLGIACIIRGERSIHAGRCSGKNYAPLVRSDDTLHMQARGKVGVGGRHLVGND